MLCVENRRIHSEMDPGPPLEALAVASGSQISGYPRVESMELTVHIYIYMFRDTEIRHQSLEIRRAIKGCPQHHGRIPMYVERLPLLSHHQSTPTKP